MFVAPADLESFGIAALEARCAGLPVVAKSSGGVREFVRDEVEGLLCDTDEDMVQALVRLALRRDPAPADRRPQPHRGVPGGLEPCAREHRGGVRAGAARVLDAEPPGRGVMSMLAVVGASVGATAFFALSTALKHRSARTAPDASGLEPRRLARFIDATARHPLYLGGLVADVVGLSLQVYALHIGALSVVQPLLTTALLFSLVLAHRVAGTRISRRELAWGAVLVVALVGFMLASGTVRASAPAMVQAADRVPAVLAGILAVTLAATCVLTSRRLPSGGAAALMGVAVGTAYACTAALIKSCTNIVAAGPMALLDQLAALPAGRGRRHRAAAGPAGLPVRPVDRQPAGHRHRRPAAERGDRGVGLRRAAQPGAVVGRRRGRVPGPDVARRRHAQPGAGGHRGPRPPARPAATPPRRRA